jgi:hypothetical protein
MKKLTVAFSALCVFYISCSPTDTGHEFLTLRSSVGSATVTSQSTSQVTFVAKASWHNGCGRFAHADIAQNASSFFITVYGTQPKDAVCTQAFIQFDAPVIVQIPSAGTYTFKFWQTDSTSYDTTWTIQ